VHEVQFPDQGRRLAREAPQGATRATLLEATPGAGAGPAALAPVDL
jgi:hypothetical protein